MVDPTDPQEILLRVKVPQNAVQEGKVPVLEIKKTQTPFFLGKQTLDHATKGLLLTYIGFTPQNVSARSVDPIQNWGKGKMPI